MIDNNLQELRKSRHSEANAECIEVAAGWRKSTHSDADSNCVEVGAARRVVGVRDTRQKGQGLVLEFPAAAWRSFIAGLRFRG